MRKEGSSEIVKKCKAMFCLVSILKISAFSLIFLGLQPHTVSAQVRPNPAQAREEILIKLLSGTKRARTIAEIPTEFRRLIKREYDGSTGIQKETKFEPYLASRYFWTMEQVDLQVGYNIGLINRRALMCMDGACDAPLNSDFWSGAWTVGTYSGSNVSDANLPIATWTNGLVPNTTTVNIAAGSNTDPLAQEHHTFVPNGNDPTLGTLLKTIAPMPVSGNAGSLRIGNTRTNAGAERVAKTFVVPSNTANNPNAATLTFWYASVLQNGPNPNQQHIPSERPGFGVFLLDSGNHKINGLVDIDQSTAGNQEFIVPDYNNPFFGTHINPSDDSPQYLPTFYTPWTCVTIDLSLYSGQTVTILFVNRDCLMGAHWGYAYIDSLCFGCAGNPTGDASFNSDRSDCAKGEICFDYTVPKTAAGTGKVNLNLDLYQNGNLVTTLASGDLTSNGTYCFTNFFNVLDSSIGGFDWKATANFTIAGATIAPKEIGKTGDGFVGGKNNDCMTKSCCGIGKNFIKNGDFRATKQNFYSDYPFTLSDPFLFPGTELIGDSKTAQKACDRWNVSGHNGGHCNENGGDTFLLVNGKTTQVNTKPAVVWSQDVKVDGEGDYEFCAYVKDLKQCCFNKKPLITLKGIVDGIETTQTATVSTSDKACDWQLVSTKIKVPAGASTVNLQILLDDSVIGDGNDLAIDDISLTKKGFCF